MLKEFSSNDSIARTLNWRPDGKLIVSSTGLHEMNLWDVDSGSLVQTRKFDNGYVRQPAFTPDGRILEFAVRQQVRRWDVIENRDLPPFHVKEVVSALAISPDGRRTAVSDHEGFTNIFTSERPDESIIRWKLSHFYGLVEQLTFSRDGRFLLTANANGTAYLLRLENTDPAN